MFSVFDLSFINKVYTKSEDDFRDHIRASEGFYNNEKSAFFIQNSSQYLSIFLFLALVYGVSKIFVFYYQKIAKKEGGFRKVVEFIVRIMEF